MTWTGGILLTLTFAFVIARKWGKPGLSNRREVMQFFAALAGLMSLSYCGGEYRLAKGEAFFREQFNLPESADFIELPRNRFGPPVRAVVTIPDADWPAFAAALDRPARATPFLFDFPGDPQRHAAIARWRDLPPPMMAADAPKHIMDIPRLYDFFWDYDVERGRMLCIVYVSEDAAGARDCADTTKGDPRYAFLVGIVDFDRQELHLRYKGRPD